MVRPSKGTLLIVEDDLVTRMVTVRLLEAAGYVAAIAADGSAALEALKQSRFDLVLMDLMMPVMTGIEAVARIRADGDETTARTPVIAFTSERIRAPEAFCEAHGFDAYINKLEGSTAMIKSVDAFFSRKSAA
jgi:CheY-like chemotaxis protein